ncbi:unnamed protein product [Acanthoscelides obtectus]|uniref:Maestro heat-like repeat-containing protein family member 1 n=2 Tax=Acanthoscelides obtectus TaxID=200917 RepID=A0A9P0KM01_ACAOB|nr:unnamed protein product [Acanthoscelides obtectus]CAK1662917.1 Maestro heat-like repeat-containing protein family member 1 [Acanthoscelides obtectus]
MTTNGKGNAETQLQIAIGMLLQSVRDKSPVVLETLMNSIRKLAEKHPNQVLLSCCQFYSKTPKPPPEHLASILKIMERVCSDHIMKIDGDTIISTIEISMNLMTENVYSEPLIQIPASEVLVALGRQHSVQVMDSLLKKLTAGIVPHFMVPRALGAMANTNAIGVVPYLKEIFNVILPLLGGCRSDHLKLSFAYAIGSFCDALVEYVSNNEKVPDTTVTIENYNLEIGMAYDVLFTTWLLSRDPKVVESVLEAIASIYSILTTEKVLQQTPKVLHILLSLYKKNINAYYITKCLDAVIEKSASVDGTLLEPLLQNILNTLFDLVCVSPDYAQPALVKSHSEVLRCYECFALYFTDSTVDHLLSQLRNNNDKDRVRALLVFTHLISYSGEQCIKRRFKDIIRFISEMLSDHSIRVKKALIKIIVAFCNKKVLLDKTYNPEGTGKYMEFIIKMCCKQVVPKNSDIDIHELQNIQKSADNTMYMLVTSIPELEGILWDLLLKSLLGPSFDDAVVIILRCLTHLASKKEKIESCEVAFVRCLALLANPLPNFRGCYILNFLKNIKPCNIDSYKNVWDTKIPQLIKYLDQNYENFNNIEWQDLLFDFLSILLETINSESFNEIIVFEARKQLSTYNNNRNSVNGDLEVKQTEKQFLLKCLAIALCNLKDRETVLQTLDNILSNVKLTEYSELHTFAEAVGICSQSHLQLVLNKLAMIREEVSNKKSKFLHFFIKDAKHELGIERLRYTVICSYAEICNEAPSDKLLKVIESEILEYVNLELQNAKDFVMKKVCLKTILAVADAMHPNRNTLHIRMNDRDNVIKLVCSEMQLTSESIEQFPLIMSTVTALIRLPLPIESELRISLQKLFFQYEFNALATYCKISQETDNYYGDSKLTPQLVSCLAELKKFIAELLLQNLSPAALDETVTLLEPWLGKNKPEQRLAAVETLKTVLQTYLDNMKFAYDCPSTFGQTGFLLAKVVPRCTDCNRKIRKVAVECICLILCIAARYEGHMKDHDKVLSNSLQHIQQQIDTDDPNLLYNLTSDLAHVMCINLPQFQLVHFVDGLVEALMDCESSSSNGSSVVLYNTLKSKGGELQSHVPNVLDKILKQLYKIKCQRTKSSALRSIHNLATHHSKTVCGILLNQTLPFDNLSSECWAILSTDSTLVQDLLDQLKRIIKSTPLYEEQSGSGTEVRIASLPALQAVCALHELFKNSSLKEVCLHQFSEIFALLLITLASYMGVSPPSAPKSDKKEKYTYFLRDAYKLSPTKVALETFRYFLQCCDYEKTSTTLLFISEAEKLEDVNLFLEVVNAMVENICIETPQSLSWLVACLGPYIRADLEPQRVVTVAFFTFLLRQGANEQNVLTENLLEMILDVQSDPSCLVRKMALQGLGFAAENLSYELVSRHCNPILSVLMNSLDYNNIGNESAVILEGMISFSKLLKAMEGCKFSTFQVTAAVRIKPLLDQDDLNLRRASFHLLGDLTSSLNSEAHLEAFREQVQGNLITLLLHLCDPDMYVTKACKYTLRKIGPYLESPKVNSMIQEHLIDEANLHFTDFIRDLVKIMTEELQDLFPLLIMTCLSYLKSHWPEIKGNAALIAGLLYSHLTDENRHRVSLDTVCDRLMRLLNDENEEIRMKSIEAISFLFLN